MSSLLSALLCCAMLLSQTPMVFAADADGADESAAVTVEETPQAEAPTADELQEPQIEEPLAEVPQIEDSLVEEPQTEEPQAAEESAALLSLTIENGKVSISTAQDLADLAAAVNAGTEGYDTVSVTLTQNIDLSVLYEGDDAITTWTPIGTAEHPFTGDFDGKNYTISGLTIMNPETGNQALFGVVSGTAYICDLTVEGSVTVTVTDDTATLDNNAGVIGAIDANATDVYVENVTSKVIVNGVKNVGGIVGQIAAGAVAELVNCVNEGAVTANPGSNTSLIGVGGVAGLVRSATGKLSGCKNTGAVSNLYAATAPQGTGGVVGYCYGAVEGCTNTGTVTGSGTYYVGGIAGGAFSSSTITGCVNGSADDKTAGAVSGGRCEGGIVAFGSSSVTGCTNYGAVSSTEGIGYLYGNGGIVGRGTGGTISGCRNYGDVSITLSSGALTDNVGGIVGYTVGTVTGCENYGGVATKGNATSNYCGTGGVAGKLGAGGLLYDNSNSGAVTVTDTDTGTYRFTGGVVGYMDADSEARFCRNTGDLFRGPDPDTAGAGAATSGRVAGVAGYVEGTLRNSWSSGAVTYSGSAVLNTAYGGPSGIFCTAYNGVVRDCLATGKLALTGESLTEGSLYADAIGVQVFNGVVANCVYYCADYTEAELQYIQTMVVNEAANVGTCFAGLDGSGYTWVNGESESPTAAQVLEKLNSKAWTLADGGAYPTLLSEAEFQALDYTVALTKLAGDAVAAENEKVTAALTMGGSPVSVPYTQAKPGDQLLLTVTVPADTENALLVVSCNDDARLSGPTVTSAGSEVSYTYTITVDEADLEVRYVLIDTTKDNTAWYITGQTTGEYIITRPGELVFLGQLTAGTALDAAGYPLDADSFSGKTVRLGADLDLADICHPADEETGAQELSWTPISGFAGAFDGGIYTVSTDGEENAVSELTGRHTISNLYVSQTGKYAGLFGQTNSYTATIQNLIMDRATVVTTGSYAGIILGALNGGLATNCTVKNSTISGGLCVGGVISGSNILAYSWGAVNCTVENTSVTGGDYVGGVIGGYYSALTGYNVTGNKTVNTTVSSTGSSVGGIVGAATASSNGIYGGYGEVTMNQVLGGSVTGVGYVGGVAGRLSKQGQTSTGTGGLGAGFGSGAIVTATVTGSGDYVGGIAGYGSVTSAIYYNYDAVTGLGVSTTDETAAHVGPISGLAEMTSGGGANTSTNVVALTNCLYLSGVNSEDADGAFGLTAEGFTLDEALYLLQGGGIYWELKEDALYPTFSDTETPTLYKLTLRLVGQAADGNAVSITPLAADSEGYPYRIYGTEGSEQWTYATENTVIPLTVLLAENGMVTFAPAKAVTVTPAGTEGGAAVYSVTLTADTTAEYTFSKNVVPDVSWYDGENPQTDYTIEDEADLRGLIQLVNGGNSFEGVTLTLANDLTLEGVGWTPIGVDAQHPFSGIFNGGNHTISGLYLNDYYAGDYAGLFGYLSAQGRISDLTVTGAVNAGSRYTGGVVGWSEGTLTNVTSGVDVTKNGHGASLSDKGYAGGIAGYITANARLDGALFTGSVTLNGDARPTGANGMTYPAYAYAGGLAGYSAGVIARGENRGQLHVGANSAEAVGGVVGYNLGTVTDCRNTADQSSETELYYYYGGVAGYTGSGSVITRSGNDGDLTIPAYALGGVAGYADRSIITQTYNRGDMTDARTTGKLGANPAYVGGLIGYLFAFSTTSGNLLGYSYNTGNASFTGTQAASTHKVAVSGLVGYSGGTAYTTDGVANTIYNCYNTVTGSMEDATLQSDTSYQYKGGLAACGTATVKNGYVLDTVSQSATKGVVGTTMTSNKLMAAAATLGIPFTADLADDASINGGYPVLHWEVDDPSQGVTLNYHDGDLYTLSKAAGLSLASYYEPDIIVVLSPEEAKTAIEAAVTVPEGFVFNGWYADKTDESTKYDPETTVLKAGDSYEAYWDLVRVTVTLDYGYSDANGDPVIGTVSALKDVAMDIPDTPVREGYDLLGWYTAAEDEDGNVVYTAFDFDTTLTEDLTLYAKWQAVNADTGWYSDEESSFTIGTMEQLFGFAQLVNAGNSFAGKTVTLAGDIRIDDELQFHAIGDAKHPFSGTFDGGNHTISNLFINQVGGNYQALFGYAVGGEIKNLTVTGSVTGKQYVAGILAYGKDTALSNLTFGAQGGGSSVTSTYSNTGTLNTCNQAGGVVGTLSVTKDTTVSGLVNYAAVSGSDAGGVLYTVDFGSAPQSVSLTLKDCVNYGNVTVTGRAGGVAAYLVDILFAHEVIFDGCVNEGEIVSTSTTASHAAGGILGHGDTGAAATASTIVFTFNECVNQGGVTANRAGGIVGYLTQSGATADSHARFVKCENYGGVTASVYAGGIAGYLKTAAYVSLEDCVNEGAITYTGTTAAQGASGIVGTLYTCNYATVTDCVNKGEVTSSSRAAGIVADIYGNTTSGTGAVLTGCANLGNVTATGSANAAGIAMDSRRYVSLTGCYNAGAVTNTGSGIAAGLAVGYSSSYKITLNSCFSYGPVSAATAANVYSCGYYATEKSTYYLADSTYLYALSEEGEATFTATANKDTASTSATAAEFKDGTVLSTLNAYFADGNGIWYQGADYPVLVPAEPTVAINVTVTNSTGTTPAATIAAPEGGWVEGENTFTVSADVACVVAVKNADGTYTRLTAVASGDNTYSFTTTLAEGSGIVVAVKGDMDENGAIDISDILALIDGFTSNGTDGKKFNALQQLTADTDASGEVDISDILGLIDAYTGSGLNW